MKFSSYLINSINNHYSFIINEIFIILLFIHIIIVMNFEKIFNTIFKKFINNDVKNLNKINII